MYGIYIYIDDVHAERNYVILTNMDSTTYHLAIHTYSKYKVAVVALKKCNKIQSHHTWYKLSFSWVITIPFFHLLGLLTKQLESLHESKEMPKNIGKVVCSLTYPPVIYTVAIENDHL